jgi:hypothetical protein
MHNGCIIVNSIKAVTINDHTNITPKNVYIALWRSTALAIIYNVVGRQRNLGLFLDVIFVSRRPCLYQFLAVIFVLRHPCLYQSLRFCLRSYYSAIWLPFLNLHTWFRDTNWMMTLLYEPKIESSCVCIKSVTLEGLCNKNVDIIWHYCIIQFISFKCLPSLITVQSSWCKETQSSNLELYA